MNLRQYDSKRVRLTDTDGKVYEGYVGDYIFAEDNDPEEESLVLDIEGERYPTEFLAHEIADVQII